ESNSRRLRFIALRRATSLLVLAAALTAATGAAAALRPIERRAGETTLPRLRAGTVQIPAGHASGRVRVIVTLKLPPLAAAFASRLAVDRSPSIIGADVLHATTGARGDGVKIGVVDDGVDQTNPFFNPTGYAYPAGFPRGDASFTTPKVIVARSFPGPGAGNPGKLPVDRAASFHGTHVAGIAAGDEGTNAPAGRDHPAVAGLSGVAPRAYIGNYRVFTVPTPIGHVANTPEIVAAFQSAVADGMNVINFSGGGPETDPANDAMIETVRNVAAAGVVPVIAAGNDRDDFGLGSTGSPGTAPAGIAVAAVTNSHIFTPALSVSQAGAPASVQQIPIENQLSTPASWGFSDNPLVDVSSIVVNGQAA